MDPLYLEERASRLRMWKHLCELSEQDRLHRKIDDDEVDIKQPFSIIHVEREDVDSAHEPFELCYRPGKYSRTWLCSLCGSNIDDHSWSSFDSEENGVIIPRWQPMHCTRYKLLDRMAQEFFPQKRVSLDVENSNNADNRFVFQELDELMTVISTTWVEMQKGEPKKAAFKAMDVDQQLQALKSWLGTCENDQAESREDVHTECRNHLSPVIPAKRILDLGYANNGIVRVVDTNLLKGQYVALSHCWGVTERHPPKTTYATLANHTSAIEISSLPLSFRHAIKVCLYLSIQYLWIDCLCIVQDDDAEWLEEAEKMAEIYQQARLVIAATRACNSQHGFLFDFQEDSVHYKIMAEAPWSRDEPMHRTFQATFQINHEYSKKDSSPLDRRAWCLQEWYLPVRLVEFSLNNIRFICGRAVETRFGRTNDSHTWTRTIARYFKWEREDFARTLWEQIRKDFFGRSITKHSDMLPALAGMGKMCENSLMNVPNHKYLAGLWSTRISEDLSWTALEYDISTKPIEGIPTWSWASTTCSNDYIYLKPWKTYVELIEAHCTGYARPRETQASLKVRGYVKPLFLRVDHRHIGHENRPSLSFWINKWSALTAKTETVEEKAKAKRIGSYFVLDMPICPTPHEHEVTRKTNEMYSQRVPSIMRASEEKEENQCKSCMEKGYVSEVQLLLLSRCDSSVLALVLSPVPPGPSASAERQTQPGNEVYQRLGLLEVACSNEDPWIVTAEGRKIHADAFWQLTKSLVRRTITLV